MIAAASYEVLSLGGSLMRVVKELRGYLLGWKAYFHLAQTRWVFTTLDEWLRHRLRSLHLKQWRRGRTTYRELRALGASPGHAASVAARTGRWWRNAAMALNAILTIAYFDRLGVPRLA